MSATGGAGAVLALRDYQEATLDALAADWRGGMQRLAAVLPTGAGKTVIFAHLARRVVAAGGRVLVLAHRDELINQTADKLHTVAPGMPVGIIKAARNELAGRRTAVASVQSLAGQKRRDAVQAWGPSLVIVDECHHAVADTYMNVLRDMGCFTPGGAIAAGFTATLARGDGVALGDVWQKISHTVPILDLIRRRYLLNIRAKRIHVDGLDLRAVRRSGGDYQDGALGEAMMQCLAPQAIARAYREHAAARPGVVFMPTVETAYAMADELQAVGITAACVEGRMSIEDRRGVLDAARAGRIQVLTNCMVLTEGTDLPHLEVCVVGRPTSSAPLFVQMVGRVLRPYPGQEEALLLDVVGVGARHRLATLASLTGADRIEKLAADLTDEELAALDLLGLAELDDDRSGSGALAPDMLDGELRATEFELFESSHRTWLQTRRGVWFIEAGTKENAQVIFLVPTTPGFYSVAAVPTNRQGGRWVIENVEMTYAMSWGEQEASAIGGYTHRKASWRRGEPTTAQVSFAESLGIRTTGLDTRGSIGDEISVVLASRRIDHLSMVAGVTR